MNELWDSLKDILTLNGVAYPFIREGWNYIRARKARKDLVEDNQALLEASVRKDLWAEIGNLRGSVNAAQTTMIELQSEYVKLAAKNSELSKELAEAQKSFVKVGRLLNEALISLGRIEEVERAIDEPDLQQAKTEIALIKRDTASLTQKITALYQT